MTRIQRWAFIGMVVGLGYHGRVHAQTSELLTMPPALMASVEVQVLRVIDGDTVVVASTSHFYKEHRLRLLGVSAPETTKGRHERCGAEATEFMRDAVRRTTVAFRAVTAGDVDAYGRPLVYLFGSGEMSLNEAVIRSGYAKMERRWKIALWDQMSAAEAAAKEARAGLWGRGTCRAVLRGGL